MIEVGRVCLKIAGRDAGKKCVVVDILEEGFVLIDGETRRRKCNIIHLEPLKDLVKINKNASHEEVGKAVKDIMTLRETKKKESGSERPKKQRKQKEKPEKTVKKKAKKKDKPSESKKEDKKSKDKTDAKKKA